MILRLFLVLYCFPIIYCQYFILNKHNVDMYDIIDQLNASTITACVMECQQNDECEFVARSMDTNYGHSLCLLLKKKTKQNAIELMKNVTTPTEGTGKVNTNGIQDLMVIQEVSSWFLCRFSDDTF